MTATVPAAAHHRAAATAEHIARLFAEGHDLTTVAQQGAVNGWTRMRALQVVSQRGWTLDSSGRVPRHQRPAVTPGKPLPSVPAGMPGVGTIGGQRPAVAEVAPSPGRAQVAAPAQSITTKTTPGSADTATPSASAPTGSDKPADTVADHRPATPASPPDLPALTELARTAQQREIDSADALLTRAANHANPGVQTALGVVRGALTTLRAALDDAEAARLALQAEVQKIDAEEAKLRARLAELDVERARLLTGDTPRPPADTPPPAAPPATAPHDGPAPAGPTPQRAKKGADATTPIRHGTWGGFIQHRVRGERACENCDAAREQTMDERRAKRAAKATS